VTACNVGCVGLLREGLGTGAHEKRRAALSKHPALLLNASRPVVSDALTTGRWYRNVSNGVNRKFVQSQSSERANHGLLNVRTNGTRVRVPINLSVLNVGVPEPRGGLEYRGVRRGTDECSRCVADRVKCIASSGIAGKPFSTRCPAHVCQL
jgi:hypothetical protein